MNSTPRRAGAGWQGGFLCVDDGAGLGNNQPVGANDFPMAELNRITHFPAALRWMACALLAFTLLSAAGCGHKHTVAKLPPPPAPAAAPPAAVQPAPPRQPADIAPDAPVLWTQTGIASWYGPPYHNRQTANGEIYDQNAMTAAHKTLPLNSIVRVTNLQTHHQVIVRITDRGPFVGERIIDLSVASAKAVDVWRPGLARVRLEVLSTPAPIESGGRWCVQIGAFSAQKDALTLKARIERQEPDAKVLQFPGPTGFWVRVRVADDDKQEAQRVADTISVDEGGVFMVRLD